MKIIEFFLALIFSVIFLPLGIIFNFVTIFTKNSIKMPFLLLLSFFIEIYNLFHTLAVFLDRIGNIILGKFLITFFLVQKDNFRGFGEFGFTISASFGLNLMFENLNKYGIFTANLIDKIFGKYHCINSYFYKVKKDEILYTIKLKK